MGRLSFPLSVRYAVGVRFYQVLPKGLYLHLPFCVSRCPFCDFFVQVERDPEIHRSLARRILEDLTACCQRRPELLSRVETVFFGGGTPSFLEHGAMELLWRGLERELRGAGAPVLGGGPGTEISLETNPELVSRENLAFWCGLGISRLSVGFQSCSDPLLKLLGRRSRQREHVRAAERLASDWSGSRQTSFDFLYGLPGQTSGDVAAVLDFIGRFGPDHVSCYELTIEENTLFGKWFERDEALKRSGKDGERRWNALRPEQIEEQWEQILDGLGALGFHRYEVSNFARSTGSPADGFPSGASRHNLLYWRWESYLGLGPSAVGAFVAPGGRIVRRQGTRDWHAYRTRPDFGVSGQILDRRESVFEYLMMRLRLLSGLPRHDFSVCFGRDVTEWIPDTIVWAERLGLIELSPLVLRMTGSGEPRGIDLLNGFLVRARGELQSGDC